MRFPRSRTRWQRFAWRYAVVWIMAAAPFFFALASQAQYTETRSDSQDRSRIIPEDYSVDLEAELDPVEIQHYVIDAELRPASHDIKAKAQIRFAARQSITS